MTSRLERVLWSRKTLKLPEFITLHGNELPKIVIVKQTSPVLGAVRKEQILRLDRITTQMRLFGTNSKGETWSIPSDYPIKVEVLRQGTYSAAEKILEIRDSLPMNIRFENNVKFHFSGETSEVDLGVITIESIKDETFILANSIDRGVVESRVVAIPITAPVTLGVAQGFGPDHVSKGDWETFQKILDSIIIEELDTGHVTGCTEIIAVSKPGTSRPDRLLLCSSDPNQIISYPQIKLDERLPPVPAPARPSRPVTFEKINENRDVRWSESDYSLKDFYDTYSDDLPQIIMVTSGFYGPTEMETYGVDEIYRIKTYSRQKRVIAMDPTEQYMSIPLSYPVKLQIIEGPNKVSQPYSLEEIISHFNLPITVKFVTGGFLNYSDQSAYAMKELEIQDTYNETYFLLNSLFQGGISQKVLLMPVYVDISVSVAEGWKKKSDEEWAKYLQRLEDETADVNYRFETINKNIAIYSPGQVNVGDNIYEYIVPNTFVTMSDEKSQPSPKAASPPPGPRGMSRKKTSTERKNYCATDPSMQSVNNTYVPLKPLPSVKRRGYEQVTTLQKIAISPVSVSVGSSPPVPSPTSPKTPTFPKGGVRVLPLPAIPKSSDGSEKKTRITESKGCTGPASKPKGKSEKPQYGNSKRESRGEVNPTSITTGSPQRDKSQNLVIRDVKDIPRDASCLTVEELCDCLMLLNLGKYAPSFRNMQIDGALLVDFTAEDFKTDANFKMTVTEAKMLVRFAKDGWRPKHS